MGSSDSLVVICSELTTFAVESPTNMAYGLELKAL